MYCFAESGHFIKIITNKHLINPRFLTVACDGRLVVSDWGDKLIKVLSPDGTALLQSFSAPDCDEPPLFVVYHQGTFFVSYGLAHVVKVLSKEGVFLYDIGSEGPGDVQLCYPTYTGLAIDKFNNLIVCNSGNSRLQVFALGGKFLYTIKEQFTGLKCAGSVAASTNGQLFVTDFIENMKIDCNFENGNLWSFRKHSVRSRALVLLRSVAPACIQKFLTIKLRTAI